VLWIPTPLLDPEKTSCAVSLPVLRHGSTNLCPKLVASVGRCFKSGNIQDLVACTF